MKYVIAICFLFATCYVDAVVRRHDVADERYLSDTIPAFFVDMPFEGAAALIDEHWLLAPAHVIYTFMYDYNEKLNNRKFSVRSFSQRALTPSSQIVRKAVIVSLKL